MTVSLAEAKAHCVVEHNLDDAYLLGLIQAATAATEDYTKNHYHTAHVDEKI